MICYDLMFLKDVSYAHQGIYCIYSKYCNIMK